MDSYLEYIKSNNINNNLHDLILNIQKHKILEEYIKLYLQTEKGKEEINSRDIFKATPLIIACLKNSIETVKLLISANANLDLQDEEGDTALKVICNESDKTNSIEIIKLLISANANLDLQDELGSTALMMTCNNLYSEKSIEIVKLLILAKANLDLQCIKGFTALMFASMNKKKLISIEIVKLLISANANLYIQNNKGYTALMYFLINFDLDFISNYLEYYKSLDWILQKFILEYTIPINTYDYLIDEKIIEYTDSDKYENSKYNVTIKLNILESHKIQFDKCIVCSETKNTLICKYKHPICFKCLHINNCECIKCQKSLLDC